MTGGVGHDELREFYSNASFRKCRRHGDDAVSRTIGVDRVVDEMVSSLRTPSNGLDVAGRRADRQTRQVALVVIVHFRDGKLAHEHYPTGTRHQCWRSSD
jgi:carboxymethylenebutenolidase